MSPICGRRSRRFWSPLLSKKIMIGSATRLSGITVSACVIRPSRPLVQWPAWPGRPNLVVISLGSNATSLDDHEKLVAAINAFNPKLPIYWVGPPAEAGERADEQIRKTLDLYPGSPCYFYSSQNVAKKLHLGAADAVKWVNGYIDKLKRDSFFAEAQ